MITQKIEKQLMNMNVSDRARLASQLLSSLEDLSEPENEQLWARAAFERHQSLVGGEGKSKSAETVLRQARAKLR